MPRFVVMPECCRFYQVEATDAERAYRGVCCWYPEKMPVAIMDIETGETAVFTRRLDQAGNLLQIRKSGWSDRGRFHTEG